MRGLAERDVEALREAGLDHVGVLGVVLRCEERGVVADSTFPYELEPVRRFPELGLAHAAATKRRVDEKSEGPEAGGRH